jgi:ABC-type antimicrobial peptide transport system permease subunit
VVDQAFAQTYWPGQNPLGYRVFWGPQRTSEDTGATIIGVAGTVREGDPMKRPTQGTVYFPLTNKSTGRFFYISVKSNRAPGTSAADLRKALSQIDPTLAWSDVRSLGARIDETLLARRSPVFVGAAFALVAFILAGVAVYGVIGFDIVRRRREIGIRMALGAQPIQIVRLFLAFGGRMWISGLVLGAGAMLILGHLLGDLLYGVSPADAGILFGTGAFIGMTTLLACLPHCLRVSRMSPIAAINSQ